MIAREKKPKRRLLLTGLPHFAREVGKRLRETGFWEVRFLDVRSIRPLTRRLFAFVSALVRAGVWYQVGGQLGRGRIYALARALRIRVVTHWAGTDVSLAVKFYRRHPRYLRRLDGVLHWAGAPWLVDELASVGIQSEFVPFPLAAVEQALAQDPPPFPAVFTVLTYFSDTRCTFYGGDLVLRLARELPSVRFLVAGATGADSPDRPPNVEFLGWVSNMLPVYTQSTVLVRMTEHDGYGGTVQEALALGRHAVWTYPFPGARQARNYETLRENILDLLSQHERGVLRMSEDGRTYMATHMRSQDLTSAIDRRLREALHSSEGS